MINSNKLLFTIMLMLGSLITMSANNWLGMWVGLEINLMAFIPLISKVKNKKSSQAMMIYFLTQSIGSVMFMFSVMINSLMFMSLSFSHTINVVFMMISIMIKIGAAPFHMWLPEMMTNLNWIECIILMTWQKVAPLTILNNINLNTWFLYTSIILSTAIGSIGGLNQTSLRKILAYSSINHVGWMMMFISMSSSWYKYLIIYSTLIFMICLLMKKMNALFMSQLMTASPSITEKMTLTILLLSIGGLPPFLGFLPKWMVIQSMMNSGLWMIMLMMLMFSLLTLFYYLRLMLSFILSFSCMNKWMSYNMPSKTMLFSFLSVNLLLPILGSIGGF